jgi:hypothetical protein
MIPPDQAVFHQSNAQDLVVNTFRNALWNHLLAMKIV